MTFKAEGYLGMSATMPAGICFVGFAGAADVWMVVSADSMSMADSRASRLIGPCSTMD
ncbi:hypothetical protein [Xanthomonas graminis]